MSSGTEYYDYPDANDPWLADLEPYKLTDAGTTKYFWRQVSDLSGAWGSSARDVLIDLVGQRDVIGDVDAAADTSDVRVDADADGDGISDAFWYELPDITSNKGKPIYAAVRIIDNGGMINLNSGYWFTPDLGRPSLIDGHSPLQINAVALGGEDLATLADDWTTVHGIDAADPDPGFNMYETNVIWRYLRPYPNSLFSPFDVSDELDLRYRFILERQDIDTRAEMWGADRLAPSTMIYTPVDRPGELDNWFPRVALGFQGDGSLDPAYAYRHIATTYNMDRVITPGSTDPNASPRGVQKMVCVNYEDVDAIRDAVLAAFLAKGADPNSPILQDNVAQIAANIRDYVDPDDEVTALSSPSEPGEWIYGFESPRVYISEIAYRGVTDAGLVQESFAIELYKPYFEDNDPRDSQWELFIDNPGGDDGDVTIEIEWSGSRRYHVVLDENARAEIFDDADFADPNQPANTTDYGYDAQQLRQSSGSNGYRLQHRRRRLD